MLIAEMAAVARDQGLTLHDRLLDLYRRFGYMAEITIAITLEGKEGLARIRAAMEAMRLKKAEGIAGVPILIVKDYLTSQRLDLATNQVSPLLLAESDVLLYELPGLDWFCVRPSGTEPKIKIYFGVYGDSQADCDRRLAELRGHVENFITAGL
jgi:phosphoglucomutase